MNIKYENNISMKKSIKVIAICLFFISCLSINVSASNINSVVQTGYHHTGNYSDGLGNSMWYNNQPIEVITIDGQVGFCVEPYRLVGDWGNYIPNAYTNDVLSKIVYHGYWNTGRSLYDYAVTQIMIWEALGQIPISTDIPNYSGRKNEIMSAVNNHELKPSFSGRTITLNKGESITLTDTNKVLTQYTNTGNNANLSVLVNGNSVTLSSVETSKDGKVAFQKVKDSTIIGASILYSHPTSQKVAVLKLMDPGMFDINVRVSSGRLKFSKTGEVFTHTLTGATESGVYQEPQWEIKKLLGAEITICAAEDILDHSGNLLYAKNSKVQTIESTYDDDYSGWLPEGKYYWYESKVPFGYIEDLSKNYFEITDAGGADQNISADLYNERAQQIFVFNKSMEKHDVKKYQNDNAYKDVVYGIYTRDDTYDYKGNIGIPYDTMVQQFVIDENGEAKASRVWNDLNADGIEQKEELSYLNLKLNLPIGNYYLKELNTNSAFTLDTNEYDFSVEYGGPSKQNITLLVNDGKTIVNELKDYKVRVNKVDEITKKSIRSKNFGFSLYSDSDCKELVQKINANVLDGSATFKGIHFGEYWIKETEAPIGFLLSNEVKHLKINEDGVFIDGSKVEKENDIYSFVYFNSPLRSIRTGDDSKTLYLILSLGISSGIIYLIMKRRKRV